MLNNFKLKNDLFGSCSGVHAHVLSFHVLLYSVDYGQGDFVSSNKASVS